MPFLADVPKHLERLKKHGGASFRILDFLAHNAVGRQQAKSWEVIAKHLRQQHGLTVRKSDFQHGLLARSRRRCLFIGSTDKGAPRGYYIIQNKNDADVMRQWYEKRIAVERERLDRLNTLIKEEFGGQ